MKISVIVAVYNRLEYLKNILLALEIQTKKPFEVIIVDDGSSENLMEAIESVIPIISYKLKHVYQKDLGFRAARSRNNGARIAEGEYLIFLDQDVLFDEKFIENLNSKIKLGEVIKMDAISLDKSNSKIINEKININNLFDYKFVNEILAKEDKRKMQKKYLKDKFRNILFSLKLEKRGAKLIGLGIGILKADFIAINGFDENYIGWGYEDDDLGNRIYCYGLKVIPYYYKKILVHMYHKEEISKKISPNEKYYYKRKDEIFRKKDYKCEYGYDNSKDKDECKIKIIK